MNIDSFFIFTLLYNYVIFVDWCDKLLFLMFAHIFKSPSYVLIILILALIYLFQVIALSLLSYKCLLFYVFLILLHSLLSLFTFTLVHFRVFVEVLVKYVRNHILVVIVVKPVHRVHVN